MIALIDEIRQCLVSLEPDFLEVEDEGALHIGHAGAQNGGHFKIKIASSILIGSRLDKHRMIYALLDGLIKQKKIHALIINLVYF